MFASTNFPIVKQEVTKRPAPVIDFPEADFW